MIHTGCRIRGSGGEGRHRGGNGIVKAFEALTHRANGGQTQNKALGRQGGSARQSNNKEGGTEEMPATSPQN